MPTDEIFAATDIALYWTLNASDALYTTYYWYGQKMTTDNIYKAVAGAEDTHTIVIYFGHGWCKDTPSGRQWFILNDAGGQVYDKDIHPHSAKRAVWFVLLWSCYQGDVIGGFHSSGIPYGMPHAWLHTTALSSNGYLHSDGGFYVFIGFNGVAPELTIGLDSVTKACYKFLQHFIVGLFRRGYRINRALDYAARCVWGEDYTFGNCILRLGYTIAGKSGKMVVYGDGGINVVDGGDLKVLPDAI